MLRNSFFVNNFNQEWIKEISSYSKSRFSCHVSRIIKTSTPLNFFWQIVGVTPSLSSPSHQKTESFLELFNKFEITVVWSFFFRIKEASEKHESDYFIADNELENSQKRFLASLHIRLGWDEERREARFFIHFTSESWSRSITFNVNVKSSSALLCNKAE